MLTLIQCDGKRSGQDLVRGRILPNGNACVHEISMGAGGGLLTGLLSHGFVWGFGVGFRVYGLVPSSASLPQGLLCLQPFQAQSLRLDGKTTTCSGLISRVRRIYALPYTERERESKRYLFIGMLTCHLV